MGYLYDRLVFFFEEEKNQAFSASFFLTCLFFRNHSERISDLRSETDAEREERPLVFITRAVKVFCFWVSACCLGAVRVYHKEQEVE